MRKPAIVDNKRKLRRFKAHPDKHGLKKPRQCLTVGEFRAAMAACGRSGACSELTQSCDFAERQKGQFSRRCASIFLEPSKHRGLKTIAGADGVGDDYGDRLNFNFTCRA